jgi:hypothetical protein
MSQSELPREVVLGQPVRRRLDSAPRRGQIVAVMMTAPYEALVRWPDARPTFEPLDNLIDAT